MFDFEWTSIARDETETQTYLRPYCNTVVAGKKKSKITYSGMYGVEDSHYVLQCPSCAMPTVYDVRNQQTAPCAKVLRSVKHLPDNVKTAYEEVRLSISSGCFTSAVVFARTVIAHIAVDMGAEVNLKFVQYVDYLQENGHIPPTAKDWVDKIRTMANAAVHDLEFWEKDDATLIGKFLMYLLIFIYELPNEI